MLSLVAGAIAAASAIGATIYYFNRPVTVRIAIGPPNSEDFKVVQSIARVFDPQGAGRDRSSIRLRLVPTDGSVQSAVALDAGQADLAVVRGDQKLPKDSQAVATLRKNIVAIWLPPAPAVAAAKGAKRAPPEQKIKRIDNLAGHRIGIIGRSQSNVNVLRVILKQYGVAIDKVAILQFSANEVAEAVRNNKVDALVAVGPPNSRITSDAVAASARDGGAPIFLPIDSADVIANNDPIYESTEIAPGAFGGAPARPDETIKTIGFSHHIVARKTLPDSVVTAFTRQLFSMRQALIAENPSAAKIEVPDTDKDAAIPVHPGAAAYVDGEEKTFMETYSDLIWWSIMAVSVLGSLGAWSVSYLKKDDRTTNSSLRERLLQMLTQARKAASHEELDQLQAEADDILRNTLDCYEHGAIETGTLTAFQIALEQFHNAVADRRLFLATDPTPLVPSVRPSRPAVV
ncbi:TAXI family TRAP transporter solute-binding subunit [Afipia sp. P52-10]|uniref:TAXI family TRAP transporter solute-binding subunit n=1 Tax=Afipia sp. P52-10 TaxID=1429916 RepID=UPI001FCAE6A0|nr:TAXI family TRAP transporter solute-binding subunit [Afipia sp. P52-10]